MADFVFDSEDDFSFKINNDPQMFLNQNTQTGCTFGNIAIRETESAEQTGAEERQNGLAV